MFFLLLPDISNYSCLGIFFQSTEFKWDRNLTFRTSSLEEIDYLSREREKKKWRREERERGRERKQEREKDFRALFNNSQTPSDGNLHNAVKTAKKSPPLLSTKNNFNGRKNTIVCSIKSGEDISMKKSRMPKQGYLLLSFSVNIHFVF